MAQFNNTSSVAQARHLPLKLRKGKAGCADFTAQIDVTGGTGKPVPYRVRRKICVKARQILHTGNPSVIADAMPAPLTQGSQWGALHKICVAPEGSETL